MEKFVQIFERKNWTIDLLRQQADLYNQHLASKLLIEGVTPPSWLCDPKPLSNLTDPRDPKMSAMEKLFVKIFESKNWTIDQLRQQDGLYNQHLASKLLIEGVKPPPWLWDPKPLSNLTDPRELNKEEMISKLLFSHPNHGFSCSSGLSSLHHRLGASGEKPLPEVLSSKVHVPKKSLGNIQRELGFPPVLEMNPQEKINLINPDSCVWADKSLVHITRSKSRQRALECKSASKRAAGKSSTTTSQEKDGELHEKFLSLEKITSMAYSGRVTRSKFSRDLLNHEDSGRVTKSKFSRDLLNHEEESLKPKDSFKISKKGDNKRVDSTSVCSGKDIFKHIRSSDLGVNKRRKLRSGACEKSAIVNNAMGNEYQKLSSGQISSSVDKCALDEENQSADFVVYEQCQHQANCRNFDLNSTGPVVASENLGLNVPSDCGINMNPKADSCDVGGPYVDKQSLEIFVGNSTEKPSESPEITRLDNCDTCHLEGRSLELEASNKVDEFRESISKTHVEVHAEPWMEKCKSGMKENLESNFNGMSVSVPNMQHPPSDGMTSLSTNVDLGKIASLLLGNEKLDTAVDKINNLLETDNRSPEQSNFDKNTPESNIVNISVTDPRIQYDPASYGENKMVIDDGPDLKMSQCLKNHFTEGVQNHLCGEMRLEAPNSDSFNYKGGGCVEKQILSPQQDGFNS